MRLYEEVFIVKPDVAEEEAESVIEQMSKVVTDQGGTIDNIDRWGRRKLAYRVLKYDEGTFVIVKFSAKPDTVREVERRLRVNDFVLKFLTVRLDERLKWVEKRKKKREERAKRKPPPQIATPALPVPAAPGAPGPSMPAAPAMPAAPEAPAVESNEPATESTE